MAETIPLSRLFRVNSHENVTEKAVLQTVHSHENVTERRGGAEALLASRASAPPRRCLLFRPALLLSGGFAAGFAH